MHFRILNEFLGFFLIEKEFKKWEKCPHSIGLSFGPTPRPNGQGGLERRHGERDTRGAHSHRTPAPSGAAGPPVTELLRGQWLGHP
jgi:hypothetical protein